MPLAPEDGQIILDEIGLAMGRLGGWILRASFTPVFQRTGDALRPVAVIPGLLLSRDSSSIRHMAIVRPQRRAMARLAGELHRINAAHVGAPGLCIIEGFDVAWPQARMAGAEAFAPSDEFRRFGRLLPPGDPFASPEQPAPDLPRGAPDVVRLDIRLLDGVAGRELRDLLAPYRARELDILLCGIAEARLLQRALEIDGLLAGDHLGAAQPAGTEIGVAPRPLAGLEDKTDTLVAFRARRRETIKLPDRRIQNL